MKRILSILFCLCFIAASARAQNWPSFRGDNASGIADGHKTPVTWNLEKSQNIAWKTPIPGLSHASPIIWGTRIFVITAVAETNANFKPKDRGIGLADDNAKHTWRIYCLDKATGRIVWERTAYEGVPRARRHIKASQANATPATDGKYVVALFGSEGMACYDLDGKLVWKQDLGILNPGYAGMPDSEWGHSSSPIIYKNLVIVQADGHKQSFIAAYNLKDGKQVWRAERGELPSWGTPVIYVGKNRTELISDAGRYARGYDPLTGKELWRFSQNEIQVKMPAPVIAHDLIYITGGNPPGSPIYAFRPGANGDISLKAGEETNQYLAWRLSRGSSYTGTPLVYGEHLYILADNGVLSAYNARTGERIYQERLPSSFSASPVAADGKLYLASEDGEVFVVRAGPKFELLATNSMGEALMATPAISDGIIFLRSQSYVYAITERAQQARPKKTD
ncbi:MAG TPA: PQQ-binding-like beta-propeller repeat protein [Pyrinomonadaceae bacterium]|jgi:outer membrane protein assembly factor BamB|nr:PQQ-binding-like beta-propeller repeat protein [Pyrinomonadaceae bacterium]